ncbi:unnamed protein product [Eruca vesicaria subsp. sativa]|uniref:Uncharacterized protein n=1 Tax=Eruca vesicaria subsp. sativa TaxID=29727 RepID=A0ABC8JR37_ERUVS|nr:unnamed protein product [Eruca vesicaria subsp. sativa]
MDAEISLRSCVRGGTETMRPEAETMISPVKAGGGQAHDCWRRRTWKRAAGCFQAVAHSLWRERNAQKHGESLMEVHTLSKLIDKSIRLKLLLFQGKGKNYLDEGLSKWFGTRTY